MENDILLSWFVSDFLISKGSHFELLNYIIPEAFNRQNPNKNDETQ